MLLRRYRKQQVKNTAVSDEKALEEMTVEQLKAYAEQTGIDIGRSSSQEGILKKILKALEGQTK